MPAPISSSDSRFIMESHDHDGNFIVALPYRNVQTESFLNDQGHALRCEVPFRGYTNVTLANFASGVHEIWLFDREYSDTIPIFSGPVWDITVSSSTGVLSVSAQDPLSYWVKRTLNANKTYSAQQPVDMMIDLVTYLNSVRATALTTSRHSSNASNVNVTYQASDRNEISDLLTAISAMADGVDYYTRNNVLHLYGGRIKPTISSIGMEYGGALDGYSLQYNSQAISNDYTLIGSNGVIGNAADTTQQTNYDALYQTVDRGSALTSSTELNAAAAAAIKGMSTTNTIPSIVTKKFMPIKDFDFGSQFLVNIDDEYAQYSGLIRVVGWQLTIGDSDQFTNVIYTNDTSVVS